MEAQQAKDGFRGVRFDPRFSIFEGKCKVGSKFRYLGTYQTAVEAAEAVNVAVAISRPEAGRPNALPAGALTAGQMEAIRERVARLLDPGRRPHQRKVRPKYLDEGAVPR